MKDPGEAYVLGLVVGWVSLGLVLVLAMRRELKRKP